MKEKRIFKVTTTMLMVSIGLLLSCSFGNKVPQTETDDDSLTVQKAFVLKDSTLLNVYTDDGNNIFKQGFIDSPELAFKVAYVIFKDSFGEETLEDEYPFSVDLKDGIWIIRGYLPPDWLGGVAELKIRQSDGEILYLFHGK